jgi:type IV secretory pathway TraG/TraD family ATPase VirD4
LGVVELRQVVQAGSQIASARRKSDSASLVPLLEFNQNGATIPIVAKAARDQLNRPEEEAGSVLSTTLSYLTIYRDPVVANNVSRSDFHIRDLMHSENPVTLYIVTEPVDKTTASAARARPSQHDCSPFCDRPFF